MNKYNWGKRSSANIETCDERLQRVLNRALSYSVIDITVIEGHRPVERQQKLYHAGKSKIDGITKLGKHNYIPSRAVDIVPIIPGIGIDWNNTMAFNILAGLMFAAAADEGVKIRWGGDWNGNMTNKDQTFHDLPHFELLED